MKISPYIKALITTPQKAILSSWEDQTYMSPKQQGDLSGLVVQNTGSNNWSEAVDVTYLQKMYDCHDLVYNCINLVSSTFGLAKLRVRKLEGGKYTYVPDHPFQKLLDMPNSTMTGYDLRQSYIVHRLLFGTVAMILLRDNEEDNNDGSQCPACYENNTEKCQHMLWHFNKGPVTQIIPINLDRVSKHTYVTEEGNKTYFVHIPKNNGEKIPIHPNNILTDPMYNPGGDFYGSSPTSRVRRWLEIDLGLSKQVGAYFANNAIPSMILNLKPSTTGFDRDPYELLEAMKERWMSKFSLNGDGTKMGSSVKAPAFIYGDIDIQKVQDTLRDIVLKPLFYEIQNRIAMAYRVPRGMFEFGLDYGSQSATAKQQREDFFNDAISPELVSFKSKMERYILPSYNENEDLSLEWDLTDMGIASFIEEKRKTEIFKSWEMGLQTRDETRQLLGKNPMGGELGDDLYRLTVMGDANTVANSPEDNILVSRELNPTRIRNRNE